MTDIPEAILSKAKSNRGVCPISDCGKPVKAKGYCDNHYHRLRRHGDPLGGGTQRGEPLRFIHDVAVHYKGDECLTWPYSRNIGGYGQVRADGKHFVVSRYICERVHGAPPTPEHDAAHSCGKGHEGCIAPEHLSWKTRAENKGDELLHGTRSRGERNGHAKLTEAQAREIFAMRGVATQSKLAERFMVSQTTISEIQRGQKWAWLSEGIAA